MGMEDVVAECVGDDVKPSGGKIFDAAGSNHSWAKRAYAWSENQGEPNEKFTAVLEIPPQLNQLPWR